MVYLLFIVGFQSSNGFNSFPIRFLDCRIGFCGLPSFHKMSKYSELYGQRRGWVIVKNLISLTYIEHFVLLAFFAVYGFGHRKEREVRKDRLNSSFFDSKEAVA